MPTCIGATSISRSPTAHFDRLYSKMMAFWQGHDVYVQDCFVGADAEYGMPIRVVSQLAWHNLFARQLFIRPDPEKTGDHVPQFSILFAPDFQANPAEDGTNSETCIVINFKKRVVLICGTSYAGEMKKSAFTILNYLLPERGVFPMHCSANTGAAGDVALFFGLSGTGKTTLSADAERRLIGDDEHGWSDNGVFNFEGGCYAKCIRLSQENEPQIWNAIRFGTVLENVSMDSETRLLDFNSEEVTENTRAAYPLKFIENAVIPSVGGHPNHVIFLTADAFGVLPPISKLSPEQAMYHFLSGYTAKVAGTERGLGKEPQATFSACFGGPFLPRPAATYASLLGEKLRRHGAQCLAGEYRLGRRTVRRGRAHEAALHPRHAQRRPQRLVEGYGGGAPPRLWRRGAEIVSGRARDFPGCARHVGGQRRPTTAPRSIWPPASTRTSPKFSGVSREIAAAAPGV